MQSLHRIIESLRLKKTHRIIQSNHAPIPNSSSYTPSLNTTSKCPLNTSRVNASPTSLSSPFQCLTTLSLYTLQIPYFLQAMTDTNAVVSFPDFSLTDGINSALSVHISFLPHVEMTSMSSAWCLNIFAQSSQEIWIGNNSALESHQSQH